MQKYFETNVYPYAGLLIQINLLTGLLILLGIKIFTCIDRSSMSKLQSQRKILQSGLGVAGCVRVWVRVGEWV
jgi:hypothetical protein